MFLSILFFQYWLFNTNIEKIFVQFFNPTPFWLQLYFKVSPTRAPCEKCPPNTEFFPSECGKIRTRKNSVFIHFSRSGGYLKHKFQTAQNKCIGLCLDLPALSHIDTIHFRKINWLPVSKRVKYFIVTTVKCWTDCVSFFFF